MKLRIVKFDTGRDPLFRIGPDGSFEPFIGPRCLTSLRPVPPGRAEGPVILSDRIVDDPGFEDAVRRRAMKEPSRG
jgi:hypothetical protein